VKARGAGWIAAVAAILAWGRAHAARPDAGRVVYEQRCAACHGATGGGDGPAAAAIEPRPRNFRDPDFWRGRSAEDLRRVVRDGKPGTLMAPFAGVLSDADIEAVVAFLASFRSPGR